MCCMEVCVRLSHWRTRQTFPVRMESLHQQVTTEPQPSKVKQGRIDNVTTEGIQEKDCGGKAIKL